MIEKTNTITTVSVTNRDNGGVTCLLSNGRTISFNKGETKRVNLDDLIELKSSDGGARLLEEYLVINDKDAIKLLDLQPEPEYFYGKEEVEKLLTEGSLDQLEDCLNFAPEGVIDLIKEVALKMELPDTRKRALIARKTGYNLDNILRVKEILNAGEEVKTEEKKARKANPISVEDTGRKAMPLMTQSAEKKNSIPTYKVISMDKES